jgi:hypothetical protein
MYNTNFVVKYHDIERELVYNLRQKAIKKQEEETAALIAKATAVIAQREKEIKELIEKQESNTSTKKGGKKKALKEEVKEEPKKRGRKKAIKEEPIKEEVVKEEPIKEEPIKEEVVKEEPIKEEEDDDEDIEYTMEDVHLICEKLYRDELLSVFEVETINDGNMDAGIKKVIEKMIENPKTKKMLEDIKQDLVDFSSFTGTPTEMENIRRNADYIIFITLFSQHIFYITHICVCQLYTINDIDDELVNLLKERMINLFKKN